MNMYHIQICIWNKYDVRHETLSLSAWKKKHWEMIFSRVIAPSLCPKKQQTATWLEPGGYNSFSTLQVHQRLRADWADTDKPSITSHPSSATSAAITRPPLQPLFSCCCDWNKAENSGEQMAERKMFDLGIPASFTYLLPTREKKVEDRTAPKKCGPGETRW